MFDPKLIILHVVLHNWTLRYMWRPEGVNVPGPSAVCCCVVAAGVEADGTDVEKGRGVKLGFDVFGAVKHENLNEIIRQ